MDPNEALAKMRAALDAYHRGQDEDSGDWIGYLQEVAEHAEALDEWIAKGGFLPDDWRHKAKANTWTFVGHWEDDEIVVEYVLPGDQEDVREDKGFWEQGLFAASATAPTQDEALAEVRAEYEAQYNEED